jgi:hypothetical protein
VYAIVQVSDGAVLEAAAAFGVDVAIPAAFATDTVLIVETTAKPASANRKKPLDLELVMDIQCH